MWSLTARLEMIDNCQSHIIILETLFSYWDLFQRSLEIYLKFIRNNLENIYDSRCWMK